MIAVLLLFMLFASTYTIGKYAISFMPPILFIALRMTIAGVLLLGYQYWCNRAKWRFSLKDVSLFLQISIFLMFIAFVTEFWSLQYVSASKACLLYNMSPFITAAFAFFLLKEKLTLMQWVGLTIGFLAFIPILIHQGWAEQLTSHIGFLSLPELMLVISVISSCYGWIIMQKLLKKHHYSAVMVNGIAMLWAGGFAFIASYILEGTPRIYPAPMILSLSPMASSWLIVGGSIALLILIAHIICFNLYAHLLRSYTATLLAFAGFTTPLFAALYDFILFGQRVPMAFFITLGGVWIGLSLFYREELEK